MNAALDFIRAHWLEILVVLSVLPVVVRAVAQPAKGSALDRWLSRYEALVFDLRKILKSFGIALPGASVDTLPEQVQPAPVYPKIADVVTLPVAAPSTEPVTLDLTRDVPPALQPAVAPPANSNPDPPEAA